MNASSRRRFFVSLGVAASASVAGCTGDSAPDPTEPSAVESPYDLSVRHDIDAWDRYDPDWQPPETAPTEATIGTETIVENLEVPWDMEFAANGDFFVSERVGRISRYEAGELASVTEARVSSTTRTASRRAASTGGAAAAKAACSASRSIRTTPTFPFCTRFIHTR